MILQDITELELIGVFERGEPNKERIVFRANDDVNLGQFGIMLGVNLTGGFARPVRDNLFWFGDGVIKKDDWLFVFTSPGKPTSSPVPNSDNLLHSVFWGRKSVMLASAMIVPILFRIDAVIVGIHESGLIAEKGQ
jgi:hypothetical protein